MKSIIVLVIYKDGTQSQVKLKMGRYKLIINRIVEYGTRMKFLIKEIKYENYKWVGHE